MAAKGTLYLRIEAALRTKSFAERERYRERSCLRGADITMEGDNRQFSLRTARKLLRGAEVSETED